MDMKTIFLLEFFFQLTAFLLLFLMILPSLFVRLKLVLRTGSFFWLYQTSLVTDLAYLSLGFSESLVLSFPGLNPGLESQALFRISTLKDVPTQGHQDKTASILKSSRKRHSKASGH